MLETLASLVNWTHVAFAYGFLSVRYLVIAGLAALVFYAWRRERRIETKIQPRWPRAADYRREIAYSFLTFAVFVATGQLVLHGPLREFNQLYVDVAEYGWTWFVLSIPVVLVLHDAWFYWMHRLIHHQREYNFFYHSSQQNLIIDLLQ